ncbi:hypothetical protein Ciccas_002136 [Cichlidogyrus casuarinus]|uniref:Uncharacterized protein n=1 Tax=Cichlidogyrus casuarinus TaxID=1844966 RepID=A0ABD2QIN3_9PLAT
MSVHDLDNCEKFIGHLIVAFSDGFVRIFPIPVDLSKAPTIFNSNFCPGDLSKCKTEHIAKCTFIPDEKFCFTLDRSPAFLGIPTTFEITDSHPDRLAVGYCKGFLALYQLSSINPLVYNCEENYLAPTIFRSLSHSPIIDLSWHPLNPAYIASSAFENQIKIWNLDESSTLGPASSECEFTSIKFGSGAKIIWSSYKPEILHTARWEPRPMASKNVKTNEHCISGNHILNPYQYHVNWLTCVNSFAQCLSECPSIGLLAAGLSNGLVKVTPLFKQPQKVFTHKKVIIMEEVISSCELVTLNTKELPCTECFPKIQQQDQRHCLCEHQALSQGTGFRFSTGNAKQVDPLVWDVNARYSAPSSIVFNPCLDSCTWLASGYPTGVVQFFCLDEYYQSKSADDSQVLETPKEKLPRTPYTKPKVRDKAAYEKWIEETGGTGRPPKWVTRYRMRERGLVVKSSASEDEAEVKTAAKTKITARTKVQVLENLRTRLEKKPIKHQEVYLKWVELCSRGRKPDWVYRFERRLDEKQVSDTDSDRDIPPTVKELEEAYLARSASKTKTSTAVTKIKKEPTSRTERKSIISYADPGSSESDL